MGKNNTGAVVVKIKAEQGEGIYSNIVLHTQKKGKKIIYTVEDDGVVINSGSSPTDRRFFFNVHKTITGAGYKEKTDGNTTTFFWD